MSQVGDLSRLLAFQPQYKAMDTEIECTYIYIYLYSLTIFNFCGVGGGFDYLGSSHFS